MACHKTAACTVRFGFLNFIRCRREHKFSNTVHWEQLFQMSNQGKCLPLWFFFLSLSVYFLPVDMEWFIIFYSVRVIISPRKNLKPLPASFAPMRCSFICRSETREKHKQFQGPRLKISFVSTRKCDLLGPVVGELRKPVGWAPWIIKEGIISYITGLKLQVGGSRFSLALMARVGRALRCSLWITGTRSPTCCSSL